MSDIDWSDKYGSFTDSFGVVMFSDWSQIQLEGADRGKFLHNMCTNDIQRLKPGQMCEAFCTDVKGKVLAQILVVVERDRLTLLAVPGQTQRIIHHLERYIIREDVKLVDAGNDFDWSYIIGPHARNEPSALDSTSVKCDLLWPAGFLVQRAKQAATKGSHVTVDLTSPIGTALRVESGLPLYGVDFDETTLPQEINRDTRAISFTKGCYLGQETVARIDALGHVNKKLVLVKFADVEVPSAGMKLKNHGQEVGTVSTSSWSPRLQAPLALAMVRRGSNELGTQLQSECGEAEVISPVAAAT